jgi:preprotein translocase subunit SecA
MFEQITKAFRYFVPDFNTRFLRSIDHVMDDIEDLEEEYEKLTDEQLRAKTDEFRDRLEHGETLDDLLVPAFATVREASKRVLGMRHYRVQLIGGYVLHRGMIAEMRTGEGKTLVATLPLYLNALTGKGAHLVTVNDYLARRDSEWMGQVYDFLGMSTGLIVNGLRPEERRRSYHADITYGTNNEFGFDYLRDNMAIYQEELCQRELNFAIVDEVDSILIDEARTPLIISGPAATASEDYVKFAQIVQRLKKERDYSVEQKAHQVIPTEEGIAEVERLASKAYGEKIDNLYAPEHMKKVHYLTAALKAKELYIRDKHYMVTTDGEVQIVDEFTGRVMPGRRWSDGIHQSVEAKEGVPIVRENQTLGTITYQNLFRMYGKLAGMTGTAKTEAKEFGEIYTLDVVEIPTNRPIARDDRPDVIFKTEKAKFEFIVEDLVRLYGTGQPVLVGTVDVDTSEKIHRLLKQRKLPHNVLNAKHNMSEAMVVAQAGRKGAITVATNMAGRGTDIQLGGNAEALALDEVGPPPVSPQLVIEELTDADRALYEEWKTKRDAAMDKYQAICEKEKVEVLEAGGLFILGTERHDSRRIDNQLRGRAGRQGDPGVSMFCISMEDKLMKIFGGEWIRDKIEMLGWEDDEALEHEWIDKAVENSQSKVETHHYDIRKNVLKYDDVMNDQRSFIYKERRQALDKEDVSEDVKGIFEDVVESLMNMHCNPQIVEDEWDFESLAAALGELFALQADPEELAKLERMELEENLKETVQEIYAHREKEIGADMLRRLERIILLQIVDEQWKDHLYAMDGLQEGIGLQGYGGKNPLTEYKIAATNMFLEMLERVKTLVTQYLYRLEFQAPEAAAEVEEQFASSHEDQELFYGGGDPEAEAPTRKGKPNRGGKKKKIGRNDPCPCGSGKKYKKCCG